MCQFLVSNVLYYYVCELYFNIYFKWRYTITTNFHIFVTKFEKNFANNLVYEIERLELKDLTLMTFKRCHTVYAVVRSCRVGPSRKGFCAESQNS